METTEKELIERSARGDRDAFGALYERSWPAVYAFVLRDIEDRDEARSVAQNVFLEAWKGIRGIRDPGAFGGWIRTIAAHQVERWRALADHRAAARRVPLADGLDPLDSRAKDPLDAAAEGEFEDLAREALRDFPPVSREAVLLRLLAGLEHAEIGERLGLGLNQTKGIVIRGLARLADRLRERIRPEGGS